MNVRNRIRQLYSLTRKTPLAHLLFIEIAVGLVVNIASLFLLVAITHVVLERDTIFYDQTIAGLVYALRTPLLTTIMYTITTLGNIPTVIILSMLVIFLLHKKHKKEAMIFALALIFGGILNYLLKLIFRLPRPNIAPLLSLTDFTYPSGHAMNNLVLYGLLAVYTFHFTRNKTMSILAGISAFLWIALIGFSRIYLGVHYPSDVAAGYLAGLSWLVTVLLIDKTITLSSEAKKFRE